MAVDFLFTKMFFMEGRLGGSHHVFSHRSHFRDRAGMSTRARLASPVVHRFGEDPSGGCHRCS
jgi:hypothetical protein